MNVRLNVSDSFCVEVAYYLVVKYKFKSHYFSDEFPFLFCHLHVLLNKNKCYPDISKVHFIQMFCSYSNIELKTINNFLQNIHHLNAMCLLYNVNTKRTKKPITTDATRTVKSASTTHCGWVGVLRYLNGVMP